PRERIDASVPPEGEALPLCPPWEVMSACARKPLHIGYPPSAGSTTAIPGGGPAKSDCYVVLNVGGTRPLKNAKTLERTDGEPACDKGGLCNNVCALHVQLCINQPEVGNCVPPSGLQRLKFKSHPATFTLSTPSSLLSHPKSGNMTLVATFCDTSSG